ncbi:MAG: AAA family ATPase [Syntrophales bacterium]
MIFISSLELSNFKSFRKLKIDHLGALNVLIGTNASGKSNFIQVFRFLRDVADHGLGNAVSMQGGPEYIRNANLPSSEPLSISISYNPDLSLLPPDKDRTMVIRVPSVTYEFMIRFRKGKRFAVTRDRLSSRLEFYSIAGKDKGTRIGDGISILEHRGEKIDYRLSVPEGIPLQNGDIFPALLKSERIGTDTLLLEKSLFGFAHRLDRFSDRIAFYNFDPKLPKGSAAIAGKAELEEDGRNLAICLEKLMGDRDRKRKFSNLVKDILPFIKDIEVEKVTDQTLLVKLREIYSGGARIPAPFISDGTFNIIALVIVLYFEDKDFVIMEEPERSIHPLLISKVIGMMKDASERKQILLTTHHPEIVKYAELENVFFSSRDKEGFSTIIRPAEKEEVKTFLRHDLGMEDLFRQDLLGL